MRAPTEAQPARDSYDVVVAGARVAGASTAMLLARGGLRVLVVDPMRPGSDALSTHALMRGGVLQLHRWGLLDAVRREGTPLVSTTTFHYAGDAEPLAIPIEPRDGVDGLYAPRRTLLDALLADAATGAGAEVVHGWSARGVDLGPDGRVRGVTVRAADGRTRSVRCGLLVGADGIRSRVARLVEAPVLRSTPEASAFVYGYVPDLPADGYHWYYGPRRAAGSIPTNDGLTCVFAGLPTAELQALRADGLAAVHAQVLRDVAPALAERVAAAGTGIRLRAFAGAPGVLRQAAGDGWALVGDAGSFKDPVTAHGITDALRDAELLARAALSSARSGLARYGRVRDRLARPFLETTARIASFPGSMEELKQLHLRLSDLMREDVRLIRSWDGERAAA